MKTISIPDVGDVDFPDEMSDSDIQAAIRTRIIPQHAPHLALPEARQPTAAEVNRPALQDYQQPVGNLLTQRAPAKGMGDFPELKEVPTFDPAQAGFQQAPAPTVPSMLAREREQGLNQYAERQPLSSEEFNVAAAKGAAGATPGVPMPRLTPREEATKGQVLGGAIPATMMMGAGALAVPAMAAYSGIEAMKEGGGQIDPTTGAPEHPLSMAVQTAIGVALGQYGHTMVGRVAGMGGLGAAQAMVSDEVDKLPPGERTDARIQLIAESVVQGLLGAYGAPHGQHQAPEGVSRETPVATPISREGIDAGLYGHGDGEGGFKFYPPQQGPSRPEPAAAAPRPMVPEAPAAPPRGLYEAAPVPEDMAGRQFLAGTEAQTRLREAQAARDPLAKAHEEALRASVEAENALRGRFPDEDVSPKYPAERDLLRALTNKNQEAQTLADEARARLDEANTVMEEAKREASRAQVTPLPDQPMDRLQGRQEAIRAMREAGLPPEHIQKAVEVMDRRPEIYELGSKAVDLSPQVLTELGVDVLTERRPDPASSRETLLPALRAQPEEPGRFPANGGPSEIATRASEGFRGMTEAMRAEPSGAPEGDLSRKRSHEHQVSFELDFGEGSPLAAKYPHFASMPYEQKAKITKDALGPIIKMARQITGLKEEARFYGAGGWGDNPTQPSAQLKMDAPIERVRAFADVIGYLANQTGMYISRPSTEGTKLGIDIRGQGLENPKTATAFWNALRAEAPEIATGFHPVEGGIRIGRNESPAQAEALNAKFGPAIDAVAKKLGLTLEHDFVPLESELHENDWKGNPDGREYLQRISRSLGPEVSGRLERSYRPAAESVIEKHLGQRKRALFQEHDPAHGGSERDGSGELSRRFGIDHAALAANTPEAAQSVYKALGSDIVDRNTGPELKIYPLTEEHAQHLPKWLSESGWNYKVFGPDQETGKFVPPNFREFSYDNKHVWIFSPWTEHGSFKDTEYTRTWRVTHEVAHGQTNEILSQRYGGIGKRQGAIGRATKFNGREVPPLSLADALRAVEWEHETFRRQREILEKDFGVKITDEQFRKENAVNMSDALYRVMTGDFSNPGDNGMLPKAMPPDQLLARVKEILRTTAKDLGVDMAETFGEKKPGALFQKDGEAAQPFYHQIQRVLEQKMPVHGRPDQIMGMLKGNVKAEEIQYSGIEKFLEGKDRVSKKDLLEFLRENEPEIEVIEKGRAQNRSADPISQDQFPDAWDKGYRFAAKDAGSVKKFFRTEAEAERWINSEQNSNTKFEKYQERGGSNYRERLYRKGGSKLEKLQSEIERLSPIKADAFGDYIKATEQFGLGSKEAIAALSKLNASKKEYSDAVDAFNKENKNSYTSSHWREKDVLAHTRANERTDVNGLKLHHVEEVQSDMHQEGREKGYDSDPINTEGWTAKEGSGDPASGPVWEVRDAGGHWILGIPRKSESTPEAAIRRAAEKSPRSEASRRVPDAPFKKTWYEMALRRELYEAAKSGADAITWTGGEKQAARYDMSKQYSKLRVDKQAPDLYEMRAFGMDGGLVHRERFTKEKLPGVIGKEMAKKVFDSPGDVFETTDVKIGGDGMKGFYDKMIPDYLNKYAKKWGVKVEEFQTRGDQKAFDAFSKQHKKMYPEATSEDIKKAYGVNTRGATYQGIRITPEMRRSILEEGQSFFQDKGKGDIKGAFLPSTAEKKGMVYLVKGKADLSTVLHEYLGHGLEEKVLRAPENAHLLAEAESLITRDIGADAIKNGWSVEAKEWLARKVEQYFYEGNTDVPTLKPLFEKIRAYMRGIYAAVTGGPMGKSITAEERAFFDKVFGNGEKPALMQKEGEPTPGAVSPSHLAKGSRPGPVSVQAEGKSKPVSGQPEKAPHVPGERSLPKTLEANGIEGGTDREYDVKHLDESAQAAIAEIKAKGAESVQQDILGRPRFDPQDMPRAIALMRQWQHEADHLPPGPDKVTALAKTVQMASEMSKRATEAGQFNAMIRILERLSPDGVVYYAQKQLEKYNAGKGPKQQAKMAPETATVLREAAKELKASQDLAEDAAPLSKAAGKIEKGEALSADDLEALQAFRRRLSIYLGERPPERPKGILGVLGKPKAAPVKPAPAKATPDNAEAILAARESAALARLKARGLKPTKALLQSTKTLAEEDVSDLADVFASRLAQRKASVSAIRQNFRESFGEEIAPYLDEIAQKGARRLQETRRERVKLTELSKRVDAILDPLMKGAPQEVHQAEQLRAAFDAIKDLTGDAKREASWDMQEALNAMVPAGSGKKWAATLAIAQLLNPKTAARNVIGNELFHAAERASKWVAANGIDWARSKLTGTDRALTFRTGYQSEYWRQLMLGTKAALRGVNPDGMESKYDLSGSAFQDKRNPFYWAERALGVTMRATDYAAYKRAFGETMGEMAELSADRKKIPDSQRKAYIDKWVEDAAPEVVEIAEAYGKYATFQDATALATGAAGLKKFLNAGKDFGLGNFIINYPKTPANILMRAIEYSPAGLVKSLHLLSEPWRTGLPRDVRELEMSLGRVLVGGAGGALAWYLAKNGALSGQADKERDVRSFKKEQTGEGNYQVNVSAIGRWLASGLKKDQLNKRDGDKLISYDWAQPLAINAAMTATAVQALSDKRHPIEGAFAMAEAGLEGSTKTLEEQPLLSGLEKIFNSDKSIPGRLMDVLEGIPASFSPTILNQIRQIKDNTARDTQAPTAAARMVNKVMYRLPFLSEKLPAIYKTLGKSEPRENYQNGTNGLFNVFLNPAFVAKYHIDPGLEIILGPYEAEGRKNQFPKSLSKRQIQYSERGEKKSYDLSGAELSELQRQLAQETYRRFQSIKPENLKTKSPEIQEKILADGVNDSWNRVRKEFLREKGIKVK